MLSHGVWVGTPDFDGETQLRLERCPRCEGDGKAHGADRPFEWSGPGTYPGSCPICGGTGKNPSGVPKNLPYYVGPVPRGVLFPLCGMNVMVRKEALPYLYFAPMGPDSGVPGLHRFGDIWMGISLKTHFDYLGWACYTGASTVLHTRASDAARNFDQEKVGRRWNELLRQRQDPGMLPRFGSWFQYTVGDEQSKKDAEGLAKYCDSWRDKCERYAYLIRSIQEKS